MRKKDKDNDILDFFAEAGKLKRVKRSGWWMVGVPEEESVADHSFRCSVIGYILAKMENADASRVMVMTLFNDFHEARINDLHKVAAQYVDLKKAEKKAFNDQIRDMDKPIKKDLAGLREEYDLQKTKESLIARDADILECLIQAKEYVDAGITNAERFFKSGPKHLKTKSACRLWRKVKTWNSSDWWERLGKFER
ncbi:MAG: HD domain-containing protein [Candidatus Omnitrophota bacterium]